MFDYFVGLKDRTIVVPGVTNASVSETGDLVLGNADGPIVVYAAGQWLFCGNLSHQASIEAATAAYVAAQNGGA